MKKSDKFIIAISIISIFFWASVFTFQEPRKNSTPTANFKYASIFDVHELENINFLKEYSKYSGLDINVHSSTNRSKLSISGYGFYEPRESLLDYNENNKLQEIDFGVLNTRFDTHANIKSKEILGKYTYYNDNYQSTKIGIYTLGKVKCLEPCFISFSGQLYISEKDKTLYITIEKHKVKHIYYTQDEKFFRENGYAFITIIAKGTRTSYTRRPAIRGYELLIFGNSIQKNEWIIDRDKSFSMDLSEISSISGDTTKCFKLHCKLHIKALVFIDRYGNLSIKNIHHVIIL